MILSLQGSDIRSHDFELSVANQTVKGCSHDFRAENNYLTYFCLTMIHMYSMYATVQVFDPNCLQLNLKSTINVHVY